MKWLKRIGVGIAVLVVVLAVAGGAVYLATGPEMPAEGSAGRA